MRRALLLGVLLAVVWSGSAGAQTVISPESDSSRPYQRWVDTARVPTPDVRLRVVRGGCPNGADACTNPTERTIYLSGGGRARYSFFHELGHQFDYVEMDDQRRNDLLVALGLNGPWREPSLQWESPHERFAAGYENCANGRWAHLERRLGSFVSPEFGHRQHFFCEFLRG